MFLNSEIYPYPAVFIIKYLSSSLPIRDDINLTPESAVTLPDIGSPIPRADGSE